MVQLMMFWQFFFSQICNGTLAIKKARGISFWYRLLPTEICVHQHFSLLMPVFFLLPKKKKKTFTWGKFPFQRKFQFQIRRLAENPVGCGSAVAWMIIFHKEMVPRSMRSIQVEIWFAPTKPWAMGFLRIPS